MLLFCLFIYTFYQASYGRLLMLEFKSNVYHTIVEIENIDLQTTYMELCTVMFGTLLRCCTVMRRRGRVQAHSSIDNLVP